MIHDRWLLLKIKFGTITYRHTQMQKKMRTLTMPNYYDLFEIYANLTATGKYSRAGKDLGAKDSVCNVVSSPKDAENEVAGGGHEEESQSDDEIEICDLKSKHKPMAPPCPQQPKKAKKSTGEGMVDALSAMALAGYIIG
ncbi:hypothetical protein L1049_022024 [Liquidambar formosana]|uniref:Uncharacterized protein n=1 Tax=Liquidambar formosana TaxID=63359 RepID=A0AAP0RD21_LIQFO